MLKRNSLKLGLRCPILLVLVGACTQIPGEATRVSADTNPPPEELAIIHAMIQDTWQLGPFENGRYNPTRVIVKSVVSFGPIFEFDPEYGQEDPIPVFLEDAESRGQEFLSAFKDFLGNNQGEFEFDFPDAWLPKIKVIDTKELHEYFSRENGGSMNGWEDFYFDHPGAIGMVTISRPGISMEGTTAFLYLGHQSGIRAGGGYIRVLKKSNGVWRVLDEIFGGYWVS